MHSEEFIEQMMTEIQRYVCKEVNWIEACAFYMEKYDIDAETFGAIVLSNPKLLAEISSDAKTLGSVKLDYATLF